MELIITGEELLPGDIVIQFCTQKGGKLMPMFFGPILIIAQLGFTELVTYCTQQFAILRFGELVVSQKTFLAPEYQVWRCP